MSDWRNYWFEDRTDAKEFTFMLAMKEPNSLVSMSPAKNGNGFTVSVLANAEKPGMFIKNSATAKVSAPTETTTPADTPKSTGSEPF